MSKLETWHIILGIVIALGGIFGGAYALDCHWNEDEQINDVMLVATSNKKMILEQEMQRICEKYRMNWPCSTDPMSPQDKGRYLMYQKWWEAERSRMDQQLGGK